MSSEGNEVVITVNSRQAIAFSILTVIVVGSVISYVIALFAFIAPNQDLRWESEVLPLEYFDVPTGSFLPGQRVSITGSVTEGTQYWVPPGANYFDFTSVPTVRWIVIVKDLNDMPVYFYSNEVTDSGDFDLPQVHFYLADDAQTGTYTVRAILWSSWLPSGISRTLTVVERTFWVGPT